MNYLTNLNLNQNEIQNAVIQPLAVAPSNPKEGQIYYNSTDKFIYRYNGTAWGPIGVVYQQGSTTGAVITGLDNNGKVTTTNVINLTMTGYTPVSGGYVSSNMTMQQAFAALDEAVKNAVAGGGKVDDYTDLNNKPKINGVELSGDKTSADLKISVPTDEQVANAVEAWLDKHPEATNTVADGSITEAKLADGAVSAQKTGFLVFSGTSENLFNKATVTDGKNIYQGAPYNQLLDSDTGCVSDFIPVEANTGYCRSANSFESTGTAVAYQYTFFYDADKNGLNHLRHYYRSKSFTTPENCAYIRINLPMDCKDIAMVVKGSTEPSEYVPYREYYRLGEAITIGVNNIESLSAIFEAMPDGSITEAKLADEVTDEIESVDSRINTAAGWNDVRQPTQTLTGRINVFEKVVKGVFRIASDISDKTIVVHGANYFDKNDLILGKINTSNGTIQNVTNGYYTEHLIPISPGTKLYYNRNNADGTRSYVIFHQYGADGAWLRYKAIGTVASSTFTLPDDVYFIRIYLENIVDIEAEKLCVADVDIGNTLYGGYDSMMPLDGGSGKLYFGKTVYVPYCGYRIENGVLVSVSDTYTVEEYMHVDVVGNSEIEVTAPVEGFDESKLKNVVLKYGRYADTDYTLARIFKSTITGNTITPKLIAFNPGGKTMNELAKENDFVMAINAGVFNTDDNSCIGVVIADGVVVADHIDHVYSGASDVLAINSSGDLLSYDYTTTTADMLSAGVVGAVSGKNPLIVNYVKYNLDTAAEKLGDSSLITSKHPRTVIGQYKNGDYLVFTCGGRETNQAGMNCAEMQEILVNEGVKYAYNLDGGGSCNMRFFKKELAPFTEGRANPTYIVFN